MTEETKKIFSGSEVGVLIEDFEGQVKTLADGIVSLDEKVDKGFAEMNGKFEQIDERLLKIETELSIIRNDLKEKVGRDEFKLLEAKVLRLEKNLLNRK